ncbi:hypothetical protein [Siphonobacter sp. SORGH_AS_0500]|uniref:hypothetical protein n=1 Tax=Siphonobacter sp. SORGH_AS_0500 TaxID=1864824 RepID=UPI0028559B17|nr:hypothetical protein [Siphonobacter sp. SORGH_AS_0500]MDR6195197.1 hypothetical protein [Siphonobacter sp. SORGH_AS_0500]
MEQITQVVITQTDDFPCGECRRAFNLAKIHQDKIKWETAKDFYQGFLETFTLDVKNSRKGLVEFGWLEFPYKLGIYLRNQKGKTVFVEIIQVHVRDFGVIA